jgi:hypothetical protein
MRYSRNRFLALCLPLLAPVAFATPIRVSGSGTFVADWVDADSGFTISFSGSNGVESITLIADCGGGGWGGSSVWGMPGHCDGSATINGLYFQPGLDGGAFDFALGNGSGYANGSNDLGQSAYVSLIGYVSSSVTSCIGSPPHQTCTGSFVVVPTPEPASFAFGLLGLGAIALRIATKHAGR